MSDQRTRHPQHSWPARLRRLARRAGAGLASRTVHPSVAPLLLSALRSLSHVDAFCEIDATGRTRFVNSAAVKLLGWDPGSTLANLPVHDLLHPGVRIDEAICPIHCALDFGEVYHVTHDRFRTRTGTGVDVEYLCTPLTGTDDGNRVVGAVITFHGIGQPIAG